MRIRAGLLAVTVVITMSACESEIDDKTAARVAPVPQQSGSVAASAATATTTAPDPGATVVEVDQQNSAIHFIGAKVTRDHKGQFHEFDGWVEYGNGAPASLAFSIDLDSIETDEEKLTAHLKTPDFFDVARFPEATFISRSITPIAAESTGGPTHEVRGTLTMHGVSRQVMFPVTVVITDEGIHTTSEFTIDRHDWGISYRGAADDLIKDEVLIRLDLRFPPPPSPAPVTSPA